MRRLVALAFALVVACGDGGTGSPPDAVAPTPPVITSGPEFTLAPGAPLAGTVTLVTDVPTAIEVLVTDPSRSYRLKPGQPAELHEVPVLGLRPDTAHEIEVVVTDADGESRREVVATVHTDPLPEDMPEVTFTDSAPSRMEPGVTLFDAGNYIVMVDADGEVVWYYRPPARAHDLRRTSSGTIVFNYRNRKGAAEVDILGNTVSRWFTDRTTEGEPGAVGLDVDSLHHDLGETADGTFLGLSSEVRAIEGFPTSPTDPTPRSEPFNVVGDVVVEFTRTGGIENRWKLLDIIDPYRVAYDSYGNYWDGFYSDRGGGVDWAHANAVVREPATGHLVVSFRHQDAVVAFDEAGALQWILGPHANWGAELQPYLLEPANAEFQWPYHLHAPMFTDEGTLLLFDNGVYRASPPDPKDPDWTSRAVEYAIDTESMKVRQVWEYWPDPPIAARYLGDADYLPETGNALVSFRGPARIVEVTRTDPPEVLFDITVAADPYQAERVPLVPRALDVRLE